MGKYKETVTDISEESDQHMKDKSKMVLNWDDLQELQGQLVKIVDKQGETYIGCLSLNDDTIILSHIIGEDFECDACTWDASGQYYTYKPTNKDIYSIARFAREEETKKERVVRSIEFVTGTTKNPVQSYNIKTAKSDVGKNRVDLLPYAGLASGARAFNYGLLKYGHENYRTAASTRPFIAAAIRHLYQKLGGEVEDFESGLDHLDHAIACLLMAAQQHVDGKPMNDTEAMKSTGWANEVK